MTILQGQPTYKNELGECYRILKKARDFTSAKRNGKRRGALLSVRLGDKFVAEEIFRQLYEFFVCRTREIAPISGNHEKLVTGISSDVLAVLNDICTARAAAPLF